MGAILLRDVLTTIPIVVLLSIPLAVTAWAFLDAASRPRWVWAFAGRRQIVWMCIIAFGILTVIGGLAISSWYLFRIRPELAAIEDGQFG